MAHRQTGAVDSHSSKSQKTIYQVSGKCACSRILDRIATQELKARTYNEQIIYRAAWLVVWFAFFGSDPDPFGAAVCKMEFHRMNAHFPGVKPRIVEMPAKIRMGSRILRITRLLIPPMEQPEGSKWQRPNRPRQRVIMRVLLDTVMGSRCWRDKLECGHSVEWIQHAPDMPMARRRECEACYEAAQSAAGAAVPQKAKGAAA